VVGQSWRMNERDCAVRRGDGWTVWAGSVNRNAWHRVWSSNTYKQIRSRQQQQLRRTVISSTTYWYDCIYLDL